MKITYDDNRCGPESGFAVWLRRLILLWLMVVTVEYACLPAELRDLSRLDGIALMSPLRMALVATLTAALLFLLRRWITAGVERALIAMVLTALIVGSLLASFTWPFFVMCLLVLALTLIYACYGWNGSGRWAALRCAEKKGPGKAVVGATVLFFLFVSVWTVCRVYSFSVPTYDFGIFAQMFHSMKTTGLPMTTVERDGMLSHFAVHVSPIYYLMLPFYWIVPIPATLQVLQAAVLASAVIPLWKLGKHHNLTPVMRFYLCLLLLVYPAYAGGTSYDIHENAYLTPLILWLL